MCYHFGPEWTWEQWQWRGTAHSPKLQHYWNLTIRLFSVISGTFVTGVFSLSKKGSRCILQPQPTGQPEVRKILVAVTYRHIRYLPSYTGQNSKFKSPAMRNNKSSCVRLWNVTCESIDWSIDFNDTSSRLGLFYALRSGNCVHI